MKQFKTELHCHSGIVSACGRISPERIVERFVEAGYTTLVLTEHLSRSTFDVANYGGGADWQERMDFYLSAYKNLCHVAENKLHVLLGCEVRLDHHTSSDYLIYGVDESFLRGHTALTSYSLSALSQVVHKAGGLLIQAHPFRNDMLVTNPQRIDGIEVFNGNPHALSRNDVAEYWAARFPMIRTSGSDLHLHDDPISGGILTDAPITTNKELVETLKSGNYSLLSDPRVLRQE